MTAPQPQLSVVIPTHNTRELTLACLASLAHESGTEVVVVDDGSQDGTAEMISRHHPQTTVLTNEASQGFTRSVNRGLTRARGEVLLLLNSDTEVAPGAFAALHTALAADPHLGIVGARLSYPDGRPQWSGGARPTALWFFALGSGAPAALSRFPLYRALRRRPSPGPVQPVAWVTGAALALRRAVWEQVGPLDESFTFYAQDLDLCLRAREAGWGVAIADGFRVVHHHGATIRPRAGDNPLPYSPRLLWTDLVRWAGKVGGDRQARAWGRWLAWGARLRLAARAASGPFGASRRPGWQQETEALRAGLQALRQAA